MNVGKSKAMVYSHEANLDRLNFGLQGNVLEEAGCLKYLGATVAADWKMDEGLKHE